MDFESVRKQRFEWEEKANITGVPAGTADGPKKLQMGNLQAIFCFLLIGLIAGTVAFIFENVMGRLRYTSKWKSTKAFEERNQKHDKTKE